MDKNILEYANNFSKIFTEQVEPKLKNLEKDRILAKKNAEKYSKLAAIVSISFLAIMSFIFLLNFALIFRGEKYIIIIVIIILILFDIVMVKLMMKIQFISQKRNLEQSIKTKVMDVIMPAFGDFKCTKEDIIDKKTIADSKIIPYFNNIIYDDMFCGTYKNIKICLAETLLLILESDIDINDSFKNYNNKPDKFNITGEAYIKSYRDMLASKYLNYNVFNGIMLLVQIQKKFTGHTIILPHKQNINFKYNEIKLEDIKFSKQFRVYSTDQIEARYLLTPSVMERLKNIQNKFSGETISCSFKDNSLLIAITTNKDLFSLGDLNTPVTDTKQYQTFLDELISIFEIIEELKLYENTGL